MKSNSNLLKEAMADAQAVKKLAYDNALKQLQESFQPTIQRMITQQLAEEEELEDDPLENMPTEEMEDPTPDFPTEDEPVSEEDVPMDPAADEFESDDEELDAVLADLDSEGDDPADDDVSISDEELDEILQELESCDDDPVNEEEDPLADAPTDTEDVMELKKEITRLRKENKQLKGQVNETMKVVEVQKGAIAEVTILNTKLGYSQKIMSKFNLTESQKTKVLQAFDRANTVKEAKLVFATIMESFKGQPTTKLKENVSSASRQTTVISKKPSAGIISEATRARFEQLAGIKK